MNRCYIALGSNLENPKAQIEKAIEAIKSLGTVEAISPFYRSKAVGPGKQPDYVNAALALHTQLQPLTLLDALQAIADKQGRIRTIRFGARTLDLDILLFNQQKINHPRLSVPHPRMLERNFVIQPLFDIAPNLVLGGGTAISVYQEQLGYEHLEKLN